MNPRLVGTIIIGCLAIIFIPIILDGEGVEPPELLSPPPPTPNLPSVPQVAIPTRPIIHADTQEIFIDQEPEPSAESITNNLSLNEQGIPQAWSVRLGAFAEQKNASDLTTSLIEAGYKAYVKYSESNQGLLSIVYVGPVLNNIEIQDMQLKLAQEFDLNGIIVEFSIDETEQ